MSFPGHPEAKAEKWVCIDLIKARLPKAHHAKNFQKKKAGGVSSASEREKGG